MQDDSDIESYCGIPSEKEGEDVFYLLILFTHFYAITTVSNEISLDETQHIK
jgi:hypothetical protein